MAVDAAAFVGAGILILLLRFGHLGGSQLLGLGRERLQLSYLLTIAAFVPIWLACLASAGLYEARIMGSSNEEYRRLLKGSVHTIAALGLLGYAFRFEIARLLVIFIAPGAMLIAAVAKHYLRRALWRARRAGHHKRRVVVAGYENSITPLISHLMKAPEAGLEVVAVSTGLADGDSLPVGDKRLPLIAPGRVGLLDAVRTGWVDAIAVVNASALGGVGELRQLGWELEGLGVDLMVSPEATDVAGPRIRVVPVNGLALLHVEEPRLSGGARFMKNVVERVLATVALTAALPLLALVALAVRLTSPGPVLFRQARVGRDGEAFYVYKFRTMVRDAESLKSGLQALNEADGPLFKIHDDPRVTRIGGFLRRYSIDELPQLWNVVRGDMSIVGPRPPLEAEVRAYAPYVRRRFLVKPGLTGLWQVSGRSNLSWDESVRLDLHYVDNWSLTQDLVIVARTISAVLRRSGAY